MQDLLELLESKKDVNTKDHLTGNALIHVIMKKKRKQERLEFLLALLIHGKVDVNLQNAKGEAALHMAVEVSKFTTPWYRREHIIECLV